MPTINITVDDGPVAVDINGAGYTDRQAVDAMTGATIEPAVVSSGELSVSDSQPVTAGPVGNEGELVPLQTLTADISTSFTNTTYTLLTNSTNTPRLRGTHLSLTNITGYQISFASIAGNDSGGTTSLRIRDATGALLENTTSGVNAGDESALTSFDPSNNQLFIEGKVSSGTGYFRMPTYTLWGVIG